MPNVGVVVQNLSTAPLDIVQQAEVACQQIYRAAGIRVTWINSVEDVTWIGPDVVLRAVILPQAPPSRALAAFGSAVRDRQEVGWVDIAVDDASGMRCIQCRRDLRRYRQHLFNAQFPAAENGLQRFTCEQLHRDERKFILFTDTVHGADVRMIQGGGRARLALKRIHYSRRA